MMKSVFAVASKWLLAGCLGVFAFAANTAVAAVAAEDDAGNYTAGTFTNQSNGGFGFGPWLISTPGAATVDLQDSTVGSGDINSANDFSFMFYGVVNDYAEAIRDFSSPMVEGDEFNVTIAYNWNGGARGVNILDASNNELLNINFGGDNNLSLTFSGEAGTIVNEEYFSDATLEINVKQVAGNQMDVTIVRVNDSMTSNYVSTTLSAPGAKVKFYNGGHDGDNVNYALFVNNLEIVESAVQTLSISGQDAKAVGMTNLITLTRGGPLDSAVVVDLDVSDDTVLLAPASVTFAIGDAVTNFLVEGLALGSVTILATAMDYPNASIDISVYDIAYDDSSYYPPGSFTDGGNGGLGFENWLFLSSGGDGEGYTNFVGAFIGNSTSAGGGNVNASSGDAFGIFANQQGSGPAPEFNAIRKFENALGVGETVSLEFGVNFRNGAKGVTFQDSGSWKFEVNVTDDDYKYRDWVNGSDYVSLGWDYAADTAIHVELARVAGSLYQVSVSRSGSTPEFADLGLFDLGGSPVNEARFYVYNTEGGSANDLYFNRFAIYSSEELSILSISGNDGMVAGQTNVFTVFRTGSTDDALTVDLISSDEAVATVPASVVISASESSATFEVVALDVGEVVISATAVDALGADFDVLVVDIAYDDTTYYPPSLFENGENSGFGLQGWIISGNDGDGEGYTNYVGAFIGDSTSGGPNVNSSEGTAFALYANKDGEGGDDPLVEATRPFDELGVGESVSFVMGVNFRNGAKGVMFQNAGDWLFEVGVFADDYWYNVRDQGNNPVSLGWNYAADSAIVVILSRVDATTYNVSLSREGGSPEELIIQGITLSKAPDRVRFYVFNTDSGDENNLYINNLAIFTGVVEVEFTDGIPNSWWEQYNIPVIDRIALEDYDSDGSLNWEEYVADTNPDDDTSFFPNLILTASGGDVFTVTTGPSTNSRVYDVWWSTNLMSNPQGWTRYGLNVTGDDLGGDVTLTVTNSLPKLFLRSGVSLP
ncbi:MAG TPA: hypothetical protein PJ991_09670 [Kiritimatiellia bacterium]|nr:hypothetical protein [Kiritimatiellia bacterium]